MTVSSKNQRMRDPVHGVIAFSGYNRFEQLIWDLINTPEFQRLRRIKQLGFSELVYPGASHTRFSHSVGVFHTARELVAKLRVLMDGNFDQEKADIAICAALLHDVGHGPFSHAFEACEKARNQPKKHETWTAEIILGDTDVGKVLSKYDPDFKKKVADLLRLDSPDSVYSSIVSSQFDADRLDYLRRDKMMTGTEQGGFDWSWLLHNIEIEKVSLHAGEPEVPTLILGAKGLKAAEGYLLGRFHLYTQVYLHKTTRGAEKMLEALLAHLAELIEQERGKETGLPSEHPLRLYFAKQGNNMKNYLLLDDAVVWGCLSLVENGKDVTAAELAKRLRTRDLYKCLDISILGKDRRGDAKVRFQNQLKERGLSKPEVLQDRVVVSAYEFRDYDTSDASKKVLIRRDDGSDGFMDVAEASRIVKAIGEEHFMRFYAKDDKVMGKLKQIRENALN